MSKHAPAPWTWGRHESHGDDQEAKESLIDATGEEVCWFGNSVRYDERSGYEPEPADKALMAAAPKLLAALKLAVYEAPGEAGNDWYTAALEAIAEAEDEA